MRIISVFGPYLLYFFVAIQSGCDNTPKVTRDKVQEAWDGYNNPAQLDAGSVVALNELPTSGEALKQPWSDIYWPSQLGGIALRWLNGYRSLFSTPLLQEIDVRKMSERQLAELSPAEKYDIYMGRFDFPTVQSELARTHPSLPSWFGLCHGWSSAALNFEEPGNVSVKGPSGIDVPFGSSDVKALLAYAQGVVYVPPLRVLGQRCDVDLTARPELRDTGACRDTNAGSFHLVLTNLVGRQGQVILADMTRGSEIWNFPIFGFSSREILRQPPTPGAAAQAVSEVIVETDVDFLVEISSPTWLPLIDSRRVASQRTRYAYAIELDSLGRIVGGRWLSDERPDFVWVQQKADFRGYYGAIEDIYSKSRQGSVSNPQPEPTSVATPAPISSPVATPPATPSADPAATPLPAPLPTPSAPIPSTFPNSRECPPGSSKVTTPVEFCTDGVRAFEPYTQPMLDECVKSAAVGCGDPLWSNDLYLMFRGREVCPIGASWDSNLRVCVEGRTVLGPFSKAFTEKCVASGMGNMCYSFKIDVTYYSFVLQRP